MANSKRRKVTAITLALVALASNAVAGKVSLLYVGLHFENLTTKVDIYPNIFHISHFMDKAL